jgi:hypothetical protein
MKKTWLAVLALVLFVVPPAFADIGVTMTMAMNAGPMAVNGEMTTRTKGLNLRADTKVMQQEISVFFDGAAKQVWMVNHLTKEITAPDPNKQLGNLPMTIGDVVVSVKPNGQTKDILGRPCKGFAIDVSMPMTMNGETITIHMTGVSWVTDSGPGIEEYKAANKAAAAAGFAGSFLGGQNGPQTKGLLEMQKVLTDAGLPMAQELTMTFEGTGPAAAAMAQVGAMTMSTTVTAISTDPIPADVFTLPAGYTKK